MKNGVKSYGIFVFLGVLFVCAVYFIYIKINPQTLPSNLISSSGRIDGDLILMGSKYPARVEDIFVSEGEPISKGEKIALLKSDELYAKQEFSLYAIKSAEDEKLSFENTLAAKYSELKLLEKTLPNLVIIEEENLKTLQNSLSEINLKIEKFVMECEKCEKDYTRNKTLFQTQAISKDSFELVELKYKTNKKELSSLKIEKKKLLNAGKIIQTKLQIQKDNLKKIDIAKHNIKALELQNRAISSKIKQLQASKKEIDAMVSELSIDSLVDGFVVSKIANKGELVNTGGSIVTISDTNTYYLKLFIDTMENGKVKIGDKAVIFLDSYPNKPIDATVTAISAQAEFTPKEVSVRSDRIQRVFAIHLKPLKYDKILKLGIPAIGVISIDGKDLPTSLDTMPQI